MHRARSAVVSVILAVLPLTGCSTHNTTLARGDGQVIYRVSEEQAFTMTLDVFAEVLPKWSLFDITGPRRGYQSTFRMLLDTYSQKVLVIPAVGIDTNGREVKGYWFDVSGSGTAVISGAAKNRELHRRLREALDGTGTATVVTGLREGNYETDGRAYRAEGRDASEAAPKARPLPSSGPNGADRLREVKKMHDDGLITREEYEAKRRSILDRM